MTVDPFAHRSNFADGRIVATPRAKLWVHDSGGEGDPIFLLGGFTAGHFIFDLLRPYLSGYRLLTWEPRGLGPSYGDPDAGEALSAELWGADLADLLHALKLDRCRLWATGFGSYIAFTLAASHPDLVIALASYTDVWAGDETKAYDKFWAVYRAIVENFGTRGFGARALANVFDVSGLEWFGAWEARNIEEVLRPETVEATVGYGCTRADVRLHLAHIAAPMLIVQGGLSWDGQTIDEKRDPSVTLLRERVPQLELVTIPGGHPAYVLVQQPERCAAVVRAFFDRHRGA